MKIEQKVNRSIKVLIFFFKYVILFVLHILIILERRMLLLKTHSLTFRVERCVATLRDAFLSVFLNGTRFFIVAS